MRSSFRSVNKDRIHNTGSHYAVVLRAVRVVLPHKYDNTDQILMLKFERQPAYPSYRSLIDRKSPGSLIRLQSQNACPFFLLTTTTFPLQFLQHTAMLASAADIPEELFDQILEFLTLAVVYKPEDRAPAKHHMNQCSLVCKFWASRCRPRIFDHITLRSLKDAQTLLSFSPAVKRYVIDLFLEETEPCEPWTHLIYRAVAHGDFSTYRFDFTHKLDGACTPMSVQTLRSLHPSLPQRTPVVIREAFHLYVMNYRLHAFTDIAHLVRKLWEPVSWHLDFTNISWIKPLDFVPPILGKKNRATCYQTEVRQCVDRWPFVWLSITTKQPEPNSLTPTAYLSQDEAFRLGAFVRCLTSSEKALKGRAYCSHTNIYRKQLIFSDENHSVDLVCSARSDKVERSQHVQINDPVLRAV